MLHIILQAYWSLTKTHNGLISNLLYVQHVCPILKDRFFNLKNPILIIIKKLLIWAATYFQLVLCPKEMVTKYQYIKLFLMHISINNDNHFVIVIETDTHTKNDYT